MRELKKYQRQHPAPGSRTARGSGCAGKGEAGAARRPAGRPVRRHARRAQSPVFQRKGDNLEVEVPITIAEALRGADVEVPTLHGTKKLRVPAGHAARHGPAPARRGPAASSAARAAATSTTAS